MLFVTVGDKSIVGLTRENINRLLEEKPLHFGNLPLAARNAPLGTCVIVFGETKQDIVTQLKDAGIRIPDELLTEVKANPE